MRKPASFVLVLALVLALTRPVLAASVPSPVALVATGEAGQISLWWQYGTLGQYADLDFFRVYRSVDGGSTFCPYATVRWTSGSSPEYVDRAPATGQTVYYVTAVDTAGSETGRSNTAAAYPTSGGVTNPTCDGSGGGDPTPDPEPDPDPTPDPDPEPDPDPTPDPDPDPTPDPVPTPDAPTGLDAIPGPMQIQLEWSPAGEYDHFVIYRDGQFMAEARDNWYVDEDVTPGVAYSYTVTAVLDGQESDPAGPVSAEAYYPPPGPVTVTGWAANGQVSLSWRAPTSGGPVDGYRIYRDGQLVATTTGTTWGGACDCNPDAQYQDGYSYTWTVRAYGPGGQGEASTGVVSLVHPVVDYLNNPVPLPPPPAVPMGPGYTPPPAPDLTPVMPELGRRTGRSAPTVPTLQVPQDIPAPPALPPIEDPSDSPWGLPVDQPGSPDSAVLPETPAQQQESKAPSTPLQPTTPEAPDNVVTPESPVVPQGPLLPGASPLSSGPMTPETPISPHGAMTPDSPLSPEVPPDTSPTNSGP